ncbi:hypothetical protein [Maribacter litopenaei]|uniref:hypothetical protein n=1 Tax=Maribacter litopenaei TaxID=2976127 RepID=UPI00308424BE
MEAEDLVRLGGILPIKNQEEFKEVTNRLFANVNECKRIGAINSQYILNNTGASIQIMEGVRTLLK